MRLLNAQGQSSAGSVVRAAKLRHDRGSERKTIQFHTAAALRRWGMHIKCSGLPSGGCVTEGDVQIDEDMSTAYACARLRETVHAFGDGATWPKEGISGWGIQLQNGREEHGRTPVVQQNDASETYAVLQSLHKHAPFG